jgi:hypothetical protein
LENTPTGTTETPPEGGNTGEADDSPQKGNREARYRVERNDARAERDALAQRVERMQRAEVDRLASEHLSQGSDLLLMSGNDLAAYLNEETGEVDADRIRADVEILLQERPGLGKHTGAFDPTAGLGGRPVKRPTTWADLLKA